jgi:stage III sporulation protein AF
VQYIFRNWIVSLTGIILLGVIIDLILPSTSFKKYIKFFVGIITMIVILNPILELCDQSSFLKDSILRNNFTINSQQLNYQSQLINDQQQQQINELYVQTLQEQIEEHIKGLGKYDYVKAKVYLDSSKIEKVELTLRKQKDSFVYPVDIDINNSNSDYEIDENDIKQIETLLEGVYGVTKKKIIIN